jgi:hypothetical protein
MDFVAPNHPYGLAAFFCRPREGGNP